MVGMREDGEGLWVSFFLLRSFLNPLSLPSSLPPTQQQHIAQAPNDHARRRLPSRRALGFSISTPSPHPAFFSHKPSSPTLTQNNSTLLKPQMIMPGVDCPPEERPTPEEAARRTLEVLRRRVPPAVPGIVFLSGMCVCFHTACNICSDLFLVD